MEITKEQLEHLAQLGNLTLADSEREKIREQLDETIKDVEVLKELDPVTKSLNETVSVSGLKNVYREDEVEPDRILSQSEALKNAPKTYRGFFVVPKLI